MMVLALLLGLGFGAAHALASAVDSRPVGSTMCHGGPGLQCYCDPTQKPAPMCVYNGGGHPALPCPQCGTNHCTCPPTPTPPTPPAPTPPGPAPSIPVGTISNGTCVPAAYHGTDCDAHASGYFSGSLAVGGKVTECPSPLNVPKYTHDHSCD